MSSASDDKRRLSAHLGLVDEQQDWGIINADASRLDAFIRVYTADPLTPYQRYAMAELVLATANEALCAHHAANLSAVAALLPTMAADARPQLDYWRSLKREDDF